MMRLDRRRLSQALQVEIGENCERKGYSQAELAVLQRHLLAVVRVDARPGTRTDLTGENQFSRVHHKATAEVARLFGESYKTVEHRQAILTAAEADPTRYGPVLDLMNRGGVKPAFQQLTMLRRQQAHAQRVERGCTVAHLDELVQRGQRFGVIYPDPPWPEEVNGHYTTMTIEAIAALPVPQLAAEHCALILPTTKAARMNGWASELIRHWGFELVDDELFHWIKQTRNGGELFMGRGQWTRKGAETYWLAVKGSPQRIHQDVRQVIMAPVGEHSEKPEEVRHAIERLFNGQRLEMFARRPGVRIPNWWRYGNEIPPADMSPRQEEDTNAR
jgi:N6-adenosine-specific RNA methylase IME4